MLVPLGSMDCTVNGPEPTIGQHGLKCVSFAELDPTLSQMCLGTMGTKADRMRASYRFMLSCTTVGLSALMFFMFSVAVEFTFDSEAWLYDQTTSAAVNGFPSDHSMFGC